VYRCHYHVVWCPKYRRNVIAGNVDVRLKEIIREVCANVTPPSKRSRRCRITCTCSWSSTPQYGIHRLVKQIKGRSSRLLHQEVPHLKSRMPTLWTNSYVVATTGGATLEVIKRYVENQRKI
jgi:putative transposase